MELYKKYNEALEFATKKHNGQFRIGGDDYITHPISVANIVKEWGYGIDYQITALFHDLLEDTDATYDEIKNIGGSKVLEAVKLLTKVKGYVMAEYVNNIRNNPIAFTVKAADRLHNLNCAFCADDDFKRKYIKETLKWYMDFSPEIPKAVDRLAKYLKEPIIFHIANFKTLQ